MNFTVSASDVGKITLGEKDPVKSILQNIAVILATRKGTVPLYREFGLSQKFLGRPIQVAQPMIFAELKEAIEEYEPRVEVLEVTFSGESDTPGKLIPSVEVRIL